MAHTSAKPNACSQRQARLVRIERRQHNARRVAKSVQVMNRPLAAPPACQNCTCHDVIGDRYQPLGIHRQAGQNAAAIGSPNRMAITAAPQTSIRMRVKGLFDHFNATIIGDLDDATRKAI